MDSVQFRLRPTVAVELLTRKANMSLFGKKRLTELVTCAG